MQRAFASRGGAAANRPTARVVTPFGLSLERLEALYNRLTWYIRYRVIKIHLSTEKVARMFCTAGGFYFGNVEVPHLGFDELVEYYNPFCGDAGPIDELGSDMRSYLMLLAWFAGETVPGVDWTSVARITTKIDGKQVQIFDLKKYIFTCVKHQINSVFDRQARDTCMRIRHEWNPATLTFTTSMHLERERELFAGGVISNTRAAIAAKVKAEYEVEDLIHYEKIVSLFVYRIRAAAAARGYNLPTLTADEIKVFAEFYMEAETTGSYKLNPDDEPVPITSTEVMEGLCKYLDNNLSVDDRGHIIYTAKRSSVKSSGAAAGAGGGAAAGAGGGAARDDGCNCNCQICSDEKMAAALERAMACGKELKHCDAMKALKV
jgi:hypothetical protein